mmetsp:Transcript_10229/g.7818  ORF Transcript_10229/g.7818 Transcript_10229/m.7818 type:complete len:106 (+) Transcript_10229:75-392(+)
MQNPTAPQSILSNLDGVTTNLATLAAAVGAQLTVSTAIVIGFAQTCAGALTMGIGEYLSFSMLCVCAINVLNLFGASISASLRFPQSMTHGGTPRGPCGFAKARA